MRSRSSCVSLVVVIVGGTAFVDAWSRSISTSSSTGNRFRRRRMRLGPHRDRDSPTFAADGTHTATATPWKQAILDYSASNGFLQHYYGIQDYFGPNQQQHKPETVFNARQGVLMPRRTVTGDGDNHSYDGSHTSADTSADPGEEEMVLIQPPTLASCGFQLVHSFATTTDADSQQVQDWQNLEDVRDRYLPRARKALEEAYATTMPTTTTDTTTHHQSAPSLPRVRDVLFWKPTERSGPTSYVAPVHIDIDVNAYIPNVDDLLDFCWQCRVPAVSPQASQQQRNLWKQAIQQGYRFCVTNIWHNVRTDLPAVQAPMGLLRTRYKEDKDEEDTTWPALPHVKPHPELSRWYTFPNVTSDELLLFTQYDRDVRVTTDVWHCALTNVLQHSEMYVNRSDHDMRNRHSFDMRCLVLLDEIVPPQYDRWSTQHHVPMRPEALAAETESED